MSKKILTLVVCVLVLGLAGSASALTDYVWIGPDGGDWNTATNWNGGVVPSGAPAAQERGIFNVAGGPLIDSTDAVTSWITEMLAGDIVFDGGTWTGVQFEVGVATGTPATVTMNDGAMNAGNLFVGLAGAGYGTVDVYDGQINCSAWLGIAWQGTESGYLNLYGGTVTAALFDIAGAGARNNFTYNPAKAKVDIHNGVLHVSGDVTGNINQWIANGNIVAFGDTGTVQVDFDQTLAGYTTVTAIQTVVNLPTRNPIPIDEAVGVQVNTILSWSPGDGLSVAYYQVYLATEYDDVNNVNPSDTTGVYRGTASAERPVYASETLIEDTTYYWRVDNILLDDVIVRGNIWSFRTAVFECAGQLVPDINHDCVVNANDFAILVSNWLGSNLTPGEGELSGDTLIDVEDFNILATNWLKRDLKLPDTDYCAFLARDIAGKKHAYLSGNVLYYIGGQDNSAYGIAELETLGFTHPFFDDGRSRGMGMLDGSDLDVGDIGIGHDDYNWDFYRHTRLAYGSVIVDSVKYSFPNPIEMIWRPDRIECRYEVGGVVVEEKKFIADNDVLCSVITSSQPVTLEFDGHSFYHPTHSREMSATGIYDQVHNAIQIVEGGSIMTQLFALAEAFGYPYVPPAEGGLMYEGLSKVLTASCDFSSSYTLYQDGIGRQVYNFQVPCDSNGVTIAFAMGEEYAETVSRAEAIVADPSAALDSKTEFINGLLNEQIPYFRCSDTGIVEAYYYLWSLYFMSFRDVGEGWTPYPHAMTAVNNFRTLFQYDAMSLIPMGAWVVDKESYAYGNALMWKAMLPFLHEDGYSLPETFGKAWRSPIYTPCLVGHIEPVWRIYQHSGDQSFLQELYPFYREVFWDGIPDVFGAGLNAAGYLTQIAQVLGEANDVTHWQSMKDSMLPGFLAGWDAAAHAWGPVDDTGALDFMAWMMCYDMPDEWVDEMVQYWILNSGTGFMGEVPLKLRANTYPQIPPFNVSTYTTYLPIEGMYRHHAGRAANTCTLGHLNGMLKDYGFAISPEAWDPEYAPWGDMYYTWGCTMNLLLLEQIGGISYSLVNDTFTVCDHIPESWNYFEVRVPIQEDDEVRWVQVKVDRNESEVNVQKTVWVRGCSQTNLNIQPWLEDRQLLSSAPVNGVLDVPRGHLAFYFNKTLDKTVSIELMSSQGQE